MTKHNPDDVAIIMDVVGTCSHCKHHTSARLVAYYSGEILIRCSNCKIANEFEPDDRTYMDPKKFAPFHSDDDDEGPTQGSGRYTRGRR